MKTRQTVGGEGGIDPDSLRAARTSARLRRLRSSPKVLPPILSNRQIPPPLKGFFVFGGGHSLPLTSLTKNRGVIPDNLKKNKINDSWCPPHENTSLTPCFI